MTMHTHHITPKDSIKFTTSGGIETIQWRSNHIVDDWTNLHTYERTDTSGEITGIDIIQQLEHLLGIDLDGNHTISIRGLQSMNRMDIPLLRLLQSTLC